MQACGSARSVSTRSRVRSRTTASAATTWASARVVPSRHSHGGSSSEAAVKLRRVRPAGRGAREAPPRAASREGGVPGSGRGQAQGRRRGEPEREEGQGRAQGARARAEEPHHGRGCEALRRGEQEIVRPSRRAAGRRGRLARVRPQHRRALRRGTRVARVRSVDDGQPATRDEDEDGDGAGDRDRRVRRFQPVPLRAARGVVGRGGVAAEEAEQREVERGSGEQMSDFDKLRTELKHQGFNLEQTNRGHWAAYSPDGRKATFSDSGDPRAIKNTISDLRKIGFEWPPSPKKKIGRA